MKSLARVSMDVALVLTGLTLMGALARLAEPARLGWFLLVLGSLVFVATLLGVAGRTTAVGTWLCWRLVGWVVLLLGVAVLKWFVWRPQALAPRPSVLLAEVIWPLVLVLGGAIGVGLTLGWALHALRRPRS